MEKMMKRTLIRYKTKPELADKNAELIAGVFEELKAARLEGVRYLSLRLDDDTFVHFVEAESGDTALPNLAAFKEFRSGLTTIASFIWARPNPATAPCRTRLSLRRVSA